MTYPSVIRSVIPVIRYVIGLEGPCIPGLRQSWTEPVVLGLELHEDRLAPALEQPGVGGAHEALQLVAALEAELHDGLVVPQLPGGRSPRMPGPPEKGGHLLLPGSVRNSPAPARGSAFLLVVDRLDL